MVFKRQDEERRQQDRINKAVAEEREKWEERLAKERESRRLAFYFVMFFAVLFVVGAVYEHFHGVAGDVMFIALGAGMGAFISARFYLWYL
jgi:hypothetical protein